MSSPSIVYTNTVAVQINVSFGKGIDVCTYVIWRAWIQYVLQPTSHYLLRDNIVFPRPALTNCNNGNWDAETGLLLLSPSLRGAMETNRRIPHSHWFPERPIDNKPLQMHMRGTLALWNTTKCITGKTFVETFRIYWHFQHFWRRNSRWEIIFISLQYVLWAIKRTQIKQTFIFFSFFQTLYNKNKPCSNYIFT